MKMKKIRDTEIKIEMDIRPGPVTPYMKRCWKLWWTRLVFSVREELDSEENNKNA